MNFSMRVLTENDWSIYKDLRMRGFVESSVSFSESYEDECEESAEFFQDLMGSDSEHFTLGGFNSDQQLVAIASFKRDKRSKARHKSSIHTMYVAPEARGHGLGAQMLNDLITRARALPELEQIHLWVLNPETSVAKKLYLKAGFESQGIALRVRKDLIINGSYVDAEYLTMLL